MTAASGVDKRKGENKWADWWTLSGGGEQRCQWRVGLQDRLAGALFLSDLGSRLDELSLVNYIGHGEYVTFHFDTHDFEPFLDVVDSVVPGVPARPEGALESGFGFLKWPKPSSTAWPWVCFTSTSSCIADPSAGVSRFHILLEPAHTILAKACPVVLLRSSELVDKCNINGKFPLARYTPKH